MARIAVQILVCWRWSGPGRRGVDPTRRFQSGMSISSSVQTSSVAGMAAAETPRGTADAPWRPAA